MSIFKRGRVYWYHFVFNGEHVQESTKQGNPRLARQMEAAHRTALAKGEVGIREKKPAPTLAEFCKRVEAFATAQYQHSPKTLLWYKFGLKTICAADISSRRLDEITPEHIAGLVASLQAKEWEVASINSAIRAIRRVLKLAMEWGVIAAMPKVRALAGENHRDRVLMQAEEAKYLAAASEPLASIATVLLDTALRPEECYRLEWPHLRLHGDRPALRVMRGKTAAARRIIPLLPRTRAVLEMLWENAEKPLEGFIFPAPTKHGHVWHDSLRAQHRNAIKLSKVRPFVIYAFRHTRLTRLGESGCDAWTLARIAGHSSIKMSERYVHTSGDAAHAAFSRMSQAESLQYPLQELGEGW